jgi:ABC-type antimicrobial peptide transport system permease subunit
VGLESRTVPVDASAGPVDLGDIRLKESNTLKEVVVTSKTPPFQSGINGGIVANVSTTLLSTVGTANDVLQRMPGISADNGKLSVFGKGAPIVYINNRKVRDLSELERLESSEISTVELITNPGAKYDAEGRAVLLIKTKSKTDGFSAQASERLRQGKYLGDNENISLSYTHAKLHLFATYFHNYRKVSVSEDHTITLKSDNGEWRHNNFLPYVYSDNTEQISTGFDYSLNEQHAIGGQYQFSTERYQDVMPTHTVTHLNDALYETSQAQSRTKEKDRRHLINASTTAI